MYCLSTEDLLFVFRSYCFVQKKYCFVNDGRRFDGFAQSCSVLGKVRPVLVTSWFEESLISYRKIYKSIFFIINRSSEYCKATFSHVIS